MELLYNTVGGSDGNFGDKDFRRDSTLRLRWLKWNGTEGQQH